MTKLSGPKTVKVKYLKAVTDIETMKTKYLKAVTDIARDVVTMSKIKFIHLWYGAFLDDFSPILAYNDAPTQKRHNSMIRVGSFTQTVEVVPLEGAKLDEMLKECVDMKRSFKIKDSYEYEYGILELMKVVDEFPVSYGTNLKNPALWRAIGNMMLERASELENSS